MTELPPHDHALDGRLHDGCPMCDTIRERQPLAARERRADADARAMAERVERTGRYYRDIRPVQ